MDPNTIASWGSLGCLLGGALAEISDSSAVKGSAVGTLAGLGVGVLCEVSQSLDLDDE
ncbi:hypothetical protein H6B15_03845 [Gemmiger formicilis]|uniref:hypothetical protein n=1 Tax=Gemmiger formicilis TaxID=745368 RepID=UPI00195E93A6|nr:hypothetical protein [Gemmiger formicilis]MBM6715793.1 hypothetical protein [Gemmiger formicilis]